VARGGEHRVDRFRVEPALPGLAQELGLRRSGVEGRPVRSRLAP
jgi:hypothetical protein